VATSLRELVVSVTANTAAYQREMARASRMGGDFYKTVQQGAPGANRAWDSQTAAARTHATAVEAGTQAITRYMGVAAGAFGVGKLVGMADEWTNISARVRLATETTAEFEAVQDRLGKIADATYRRYGEAADQFASTARMMRELGFSTNDTLDSAEALGLALVAGGSDAQRGASAMSAWTKAVALGRIDTEKWTTLMEQTPRVAQALADGLGKTTVEMTELARAGKLTADVAVPALIGQMEKLRGEVALMPTEFRDAVTRSANALLRLVGGLNEASGATATLVKGTEYLVENLDVVSKIASGAAIGVLASKMILMAKATGQAALSATQSFVATRAEALAIRDATAAGLAKAQADLRRAQAAMTATRGSAESARQSRNLATALLTERQAAVAAATAQVNYARATNLAASAGRGALAILGGPAGLALTLGTVAAGWLLFRGGTDDASQSLVDFSGAADTAIGKFRELNAQQQAGQLLRLDDQITESTRAVEQAIERMVAAASAFGSNDMLAPYLDQIRTLQAEFGAGRISADELSDRVAALNQQVLQGSPAAQTVGRDFVRFGESLATSAREADRKRGLMATLTQTNTQTGDSAAAAAGKYDQLAGGIRGAGQAAVDVDAQLRSLDSRLNAQIVNLVRIRDGAEKAMLVEIGQQINAAGGVGALTPEQRAAFNQQIAAQRLVMQQTEAAQAAAKAANAADRAGAKSGDQWRDYNAQMERAAALQGALADAYGSSEAAVEAANRQHAIEEQVLRFGEGRRAEITAAIEREAEARTRAYGAETVANLEREVAMHGLVGQAARMRFEIEQGAYTDLDPLHQRRLQQLAEERDAQERAKKAQSEYESLRDRFLAPAYGGGGVYGVSDQFSGVNRAAAQEREEYEDLLKSFEEYREAKLAAGERWDGSEQELAERHRANMDRIDQARWQVAGMVAQGALEDITDTMRVAFGEQSGLYRAAFAVQKAAAIAQATMAIQAGIAEASKQPWPTNLAAMASVAAATASLVSNISAVGMAHDGIDKVPQTGTWLLQKGERVTTAQTSAKLDATLEQIRSQRGGQGGQPQQFTINVNGDPDRRTLEMLKEAVRQGSDQGYSRAVADVTSGKGQISRAMQQNWNNGRRTR